MKKNLLAAVILFLSVAFGMSLFSGCASCGKHKAKDTVPEFTKADTVEVLRLTEEYLEHVKNHEYDEAMAMLHDIMKNEVRDLTPKRDSAIRLQQKMFPVLNYELKEMKFINSKKVRVTYAIEFFEKDPQDKIPNTIRMTFAPQRVANKWYLELVERSHIR